MFGTEYKEKEYNQRCTIHYNQRCTIHYNQRCLAPVCRMFGGVSTSRWQRRMFSIVFAAEVRIVTAFGVKLSVPIVTIETVLAGLGAELLLVFIENCENPRPTEQI